MNSLDQQRQDAERRLQEAQLAQQNYLREQRRPAEEVGAAKAEIARLDRLAAEQQLAGLTAQAQQLAAANLKAVEHLLACVKAHDIDSALTAWQDAGAAYAALEAANWQIVEQDERRFEGLDWSVAPYQALIGESVKGVDARERLIRSAIINVLLNYRMPIWEAQPDFDARHATKRAAWAVLRRKRGYYD